MKQARIPAGGSSCMFFFSSRRRHTRLQGDWSSDVCSSDLAVAGVLTAIVGGIATNLFGERRQQPGAESAPTPAASAPEGVLPGDGDGGTLLERSEEHTSELQSPCNLVCRLLLEKKKKLKGSAARIADKQMKYRAAMATVRCAMSLDQRESAVQALLLLNRDFPIDAEVLYITTHYYSQLASRASQQLAGVAPSSYQAHELEAEAFESQGKWDEAAAEYAKILEQNPNLPGIH